MKMLLLLLTCSLRKKKTLNQYIPIDSNSIKSENLQFAHRFTYLIIIRSIAACTSNEIDNNAKLNKIERKKSAKTKTSDKNSGNKHTQFSNGTWTRHHPKNGNKLVIVAEKLDLRQTRLHMIYI